MGVKQTLCGLWRVLLLMAPFAGVGVGCGSRVEVPESPREFRAAWVATVVNIDWPSKAGLSSSQQQAEMIAILDRATDLKLNAIILQVRTSCDALYESSLEPWSEYLTGRQGQPPDPMYDPLAMWVSESHRRGIELHAWFNPYRARHPSAKTPNAAGHVSNLRPEIVRRFNGWEWLDPGEQAAQAHTLAVFLDVVRRYDIDGVHIDDYFYPYPSYLKDQEFPDEAAWGRYVEDGGHLGRGDWRRENVNRLIERIYLGIKREKPWVKFGISPFGIWRPGNPPGVAGFDQYDKLCADARLWLNKGWCDYFTPQLYWKISATSQPYAELLAWWVGQNTQGRGIYPGNYTSRVGQGTARGWEAEELLSQIEVTRRTAGASGNVHFSMKALMENRGGLSDALRSGPYAEAALVPASKWLDSRPPQRPRVSVVHAGENETVVDCRSGGGEPVWVWALHAGYGVGREMRWRFNTYPGARQQFAVKHDPTLGPARYVAVSAVDRCGNESRRVVLECSPLLAKLPQ